MIFSFISFETLQFQLNEFNFIFFIALVFLARLLPRFLHVPLIVISGLIFVYHYSPICFYLLIPYSLLLSYKPMTVRVTDFTKLPLWLLLWAIYFYALYHENFIHYQHASLFQFETLVLGSYNLMRGYIIFHDLWIKKIRYSFAETFGFFWHGPILFSGPVETLKEWSGFYRKAGQRIDWKEGTYLLGTSFLLGFGAETLFYYATPQDLDFSEASYGTVLLYAYAVGFVVHLRVSSYINFTRGFSTLMGYPFSKLNFDHPYSVRSVASFWTRWNMSIARWTREYLLFRNFAKFDGRRFLTTIFVYFFIIGISHGWSFSYVLWGLTQGGAIVVNFLYLYAKYKMPALLVWDQKYLPNRLKWFLTIAYLHITWILLDENWKEIYLGLIRPFV
jgi:D-alanyl-lipoteichoic acid acyltransferase DltB (MBOAT superfamily)